MSLEVIEEREAHLEPRLVGPVLGAEPRDCCRHTGGLRPSELRVFQIDVVNDLRERADARLPDRETLHEHLEGAVVSLVREFRVEHVEANLSWLWPVPFRRYELEARS